MFIKSQNNKVLLDTTGMYLATNSGSTYQVIAYSITNDGGVSLGAYESMTRAIEVLDEIAKFDGHVFYMPQA